MKSSLSLFCTRYILYRLYIIPAFKWQTAGGETANKTKHTPSLRLRLLSIFLKSGSQCEPHANDDLDNSNTRLTSSLCLDEREVEEETLPQTPSQEEKNEGSLQCVEFTTSTLSL